MDQVLIKFINWRLVGMCTDPAGEFFGMIMQSPDKTQKKVLWIQADQEGNAPGWLMEG
jgi:hypothetical protein